MITSLDISNFKNWKNSRVEFYPRNSPLCAIVGKNGAGKSAIIEGIEWTLFGQSCRASRAGGAAALRNKDASPTDIMEVSVHIVDECRDRDIIVTRRHVSRKYSVTVECCASDGTSVVSNSEEDLERLLEELRMDSRCPETTIIRQEAAASIACKSETELVEYFERLIHTDHLPNEIEKCSKQIESIQRFLLNRMRDAEDQEKSLEFKYQRLQDGVELQSRLRQAWQEAGWFYTHQHVNITRELERLNRLQQSLEAGIRDVDNRASSCKNQLELLERERDQIQLVVKRLRFGLGVATKGTEDAIRERATIHAQLEQATIREAEKRKKLQEAQRDCRRGKKILEEQEQRREEMMKSQKRLSASIARYQNDIHREIMKFFRGQLCSSSEEVVRRTMSTLRACATKFQEQQVKSSKTLEELKQLAVEEQCVITQLTGQLEEAMQREKLESSRLAKCQQQQIVLREQLERCDKQLTLETKVVADAEAKKCRLTRLLDMDRLLKERSSSRCTELRQIAFFREAINEARQKFFSNRTGKGCEMNGFYGLLCDCIEPVSLSSSVITPLLSVFGKSLTSCLVVATRAHAIFLASLLRRRSTWAQHSQCQIDIVEEISLTPQNFSFPEVVSKDRSASPLNKTLRILVPFVSPAVHKRAGSWILYDSDDREQAILFADRAAKSQRLNIVTRNGSVISSNGELIMRPNFDGLPATQWPGQDLQTVDVGAGEDPAVLKCQLKEIEATLLTKANSLEVLRSEHAKLREEFDRVQQEFQATPRSKPCSESVRKALIDAQRRHEETLTKLRILEVRDPHDTASDFAAELCQESGHSIENNTNLKMLAQKMVQCQLTELDLQTEQNVVDSKLRLAAAECRKLQGSLSRKHSILSKLEVEMNNPETALQELATAVAVQTAELDERILMSNAEQELHRKLLSDLQRSARSQEKQQRKMDREFKSMLSERGELLHRMEETTLALDQTMEQSTICEEQLALLKDKLKSQILVICHWKTVDANTQDDKCKRMCRFNVPRTCSSEFHLEPPLDADEDLLMQQTQQSGIVVESDSSSSDEIEIRHRNKLRKPFEDPETRYAGCLRQMSGLELQLHEKRLHVRIRESSDRLLEANIDQQYADYNELRKEYRLLQAAIVDDEQKMAALKQQATELESERITKLLSFLQRVNVQLSAFFRCLRPNGDCFLSYSSNKLTLFSEGISVTCQHGGGPWRSVNFLSGGQIAAVGISLLLAIHIVSGSPLLLLDECDASLDTVTVTRLAVLLRDIAHRSFGAMENGAGNTQVLVVSHRPELHCFVDSICAVYSLDNNPVGLTIVF